VDSQGKGVRQLGLEFSFPGMTAATVATAGISQDEQLTGTGIASGTFLVPPMSDGMSGKGGSVMGNANDEGAARMLKSASGEDGNGASDSLQAARTAEHAPVTLARASFDKRSVTVPVLCRAVALQNTCLG
jgi:hypothetical protein